jgi:hypothetical protein
LRRRVLRDDVETTVVTGEPNFNFTGRSALAPPSGEVQIWLGVQILDPQGVRFAAMTYG